MASTEVTLSSILRSQHLRLEALAERVLALRQNPVRKGTCFTCRNNGRCEDYGDGYRSAREEAFARSEGVCQGCGLVDCDEAHHWATKYHPDCVTHPNDLTALCKDCHALVTQYRRQLMSWGRSSP